MCVLGKDDPIKKYIYIHIFTRKYLWKKELTLQKALVHHDPQNNDKEIDIGDSNQHIIWLSHWLSMLIKETFKHLATKQIMYKRKELVDTKILHNIQW